jgi:transcriptional regulator with XRE-family HTH domain
MPNSLGSRRNRDVTTVLIASRKEAGLTQRELAERLPQWLGWDDSTVAKVEKGRRRIDLVEFMEVAKAMKIKAGVLFARIENWR